MSNFQNFNDFPFSGDITQSVIEPNLQPHEWTTLQGQMFETYATIKEKLGLPTEERENKNRQDWDYNIVCRWAVRFSDNTFASIYHETIEHNPSIDINFLSILEEPIIWKVSGRRQFSSAQKVSLFTGLPVQVYG